MVTVFMAGLAAGAWWTNRRQSRIVPLRVLVRLAFAIAALAALLPLLLRVLGRLDAAAGTELAGQGLILLLTLVLATLVGAQFPLARRGRNG